MQKYQILGKKGEGTFSEVLRAIDMETQRFVAIKCMKKAYKSKDQVNRLREIQAIRRLQPHPNVVELIEVLFDRSTGRLALVFELMDMSLYEVIKGRRQTLGEERVMQYMYQILKGVDHAHRIGLFHRDLKPENVLVNADGTLKLADFGGCKGVYSTQPFTEYISTRWYRSPECLLTSGYYSYKMDLWSCGCVMFEITAMYPLFPGSDEVDQINRIHSILGTPSEEVLNKLRSRNNSREVSFQPKNGVGLAKLLPTTSADALDLMQRLLTYDEDERCTAKEALRHPYFKKLRENDKKLKRLKPTVLENPVPTEAQVEGVLAPPLIHVKGCGGELHDSMDLTPKGKFSLHTDAGGGTPQLVHPHTLERVHSSSNNNSHSKLPRLDVLAQSPMKQSQAQSSQTLQHGSSSAQFLPLSGSDSTACPRVGVNGLPKLL